MYCKQCGKQIPDQSRFCRYCGTSVTPVVPIAPGIAPEPPAAVEPVIPMIPDAAPEPSGTVPVIPDLSPEGPVIPEARPAVPPAEPIIPETGPVVPVWEDIPSDIPDYEESVGSYEDIMSEFSAGLYDPEPVPETPEYAPEPEDTGRSTKRVILIIISVLLILGLLIGTTILCIKVLIPDPQEDPIIQEEQVESVLELPETPSPSPSAAAVLSPKPSSVVMPQISPPEISEEPSEVPEASQAPSSSPSTAATPTPTHNAASGNTAVVGSRYVDNVSYSAYFRSAPEQNDSNIITSISLGTKVDYIEDYNSVYSKVKYNDTYGYIATEYLSSTKPNLTVTDTVYVANVDYCAYFRSSPAQKDSNIFSYVYLDQTLEYIETTSNGYVKVKNGNYYGYVYQDYISFNAPNTTSSITMYVTGVKNSAYFLSYPRQGTNALGTLTPGTAVGYIENSMNGYCKVSYDGKIGYIYGEYLTETYPNDPEALNQEAKDAFITYSLNNNYVFYSFLDMNGDGINEMLASTEAEPLDSFFYCGSATLLYYQDGTVKEVDVLNDLGGLQAMTSLENADGSYCVVTRWGGQGKNIITIYTLDKSGSLSFEEWVAETTETDTLYYVNSGDTRKTITVEAFESKSYQLELDCPIIEFDGHIG